MNEVMMIYGGFPFSLPTVPYQALVRQSGWSWPEQQLVGTAPAMQFTGPTAEKIELTGTLAPGFTGGRPSIEALRQLGNLGKPLPLVSGQGLFLGMWVMESLEEGQDIHFADGTPRRMSFKLGLKKQASEVQLIAKAAKAITATISRLFA
jgi:uncharacterized protein